MNKFDFKSHLLFQGLKDHLYSDISSNTDCHNQSEVSVSLLHFLLVPLFKETGLESNKY